MAVGDRARLGYAAHFFFRSRRGGLGASSASGTSGWSVSESVTFSMVTGRPQSGRSPITGAGLFATPRPAPYNVPSSARPGVPMRFFVAAVVCLLMTAGAVTLGGFIYDTPGAVGGGVIGLVAGSYLGRSIVRSH